MVTVPVTPQSIDFPADLLSLPAFNILLYSIFSCIHLYSIFSCFLPHVLCPPPQALGDSSKKTRCISNSFWYQVMIVNTYTHTLYGHTTDLSGK